MATAGVRNLNLRWPDNKVVYRYNNNLPPQVLTTIARAISVWSYLTCIRFVPWNGEESYVLFDGTDLRGCYAKSVGFKKGVTRVNIGPVECHDQSVIMHEIGHVLGLWHEQARPDRDNYVKVHMENVKEGYEENFLKQMIFDVNTQGFGYDYGSLMHYPGNAFTKNKKDTIEVTNQQLYALEGSPKLGAAKWPSYKDYTTIKRLYRCP